MNQDKLNKQGVASVNVNKVKDNKNVNDKEYQNLCGKNIIEFLVLNESPFPISLQLLLTPDLKLFWQIARFICSRVDESYLVITERGLIEFLKWLGYPYATSHQMFTGGINWWPHLLSLLNWLVNQLKCVSPSEEAKDLSDFDEFFTDFCYRDYDRFLNDEARLDFVGEWTELQEESSRNYNEKKLAYEAKTKDLEREFQKNYEMILKQKELEVQTCENLFDNELKLFGSEGEKKRKLETKIKSNWYALERKLMSPTVDELVCSNLEKINQDNETKYKALCEEKKIIDQKLLNNQEELAKLKKIEQLDSIKLKKEFEKVQEEIDLLRREFIISQEDIEAIDEEIVILQNKIKEQERENKTEILKLKGFIKNDIQLITKHAKIIRQWLEEAR